MNIEEANVLVNKNMSVILSCKNMNQLNNAVKYTDLVYKKLSNEIRFVNKMHFITLTERLIGYAQCKINRN